MKAQELQVQINPVYLSWKGYDIETKKKRQK